MLLSKRNQLTKKDLNCMNAQEKLFYDLCESFNGFEQFKTKPDNYEVSFIDLRGQTCYFSVLLKRFDGIDINHIGKLSYGSIDGTFYRNIEGSVASSAYDYVHIQFKADSRSLVKNIFGHLSDGPNTTLLPDTLMEVLSENNIGEELINEIMATINSQSNTSYNNGWKECKELFGIKN